MEANHNLNNHIDTIQNNIYIKNRESILYLVNQSSVFVALKTVPSS